MPRSESARLMDFVKLRGAVLTFRRSEDLYKRESIKHVASINGRVLKLEAVKGTIRK